MKKYFLGTAGGWVLILVSFSLQLLHWRVVHEPGIGADDYTHMYVTYIFFRMLGAASMIFFSIKILKIDKKKLLHALFFCIVATVCYVPFFLLTLLFLV
ncbi:hypothetical protein KC571_04270 [candidate division WWE3 bacterium]|uniref:Uncharacterized protein n=1 Tax=candidate division WWE3 bacterium TaxID=2053526 RepID=A0A955LHJ4_UNCKA|nr:hypothetical protein [candidate division WWE3 bacterium]